MNTWQGYNSDEDRRRPDGGTQRESPTYPLPTRREIQRTPVRAFSGPPEADEFHADVAAWLKGEQV